MEHILLKLANISDIVLSEVKDIISKNELKIKVVNILVGDDPASLSYMRGMQKKAANLGISLEIVTLDKSINEDDFFSSIKSLNEDSSVHGVIVQTPLPKHIDLFKISGLLDYRKDLDGVTFINQGLLFSGKPFLIPATAWACDLTLKHIENKYSFPLKGKNGVIIGRSLTVGKPLFNLLLKRDITLTVVHTKSQNKELITSNADIVVVSCGIPELLNENWLKEDCVVVDVGIHSVENPDNKTFKLCGDVNASSAINKASIVTAVPGGIGVVTSALLFANSVKSYYKIEKNEDIEFDFIHNI